MFKIHQQLSCIRLSHHAGLKETPEGFLNMGALREKNVLITHTHTNAHTKIYHQCLFCPLILIPSIIFCLFVQMHSALIFTAGRVFISSPLPLFPFCFLLILLLAKLPTSYSSLALSFSRSLSLEQVGMENERNRFFFIWVNEIGNNPLCLGFRSTFLPLHVHLETGRALRMLAVPHS